MIVRQEPTSIDCVTNGQRDIHSRMNIPLLEGRQYRIHDGEMSFIGTIRRLLTTGIQLTHGETVPPEWFYEEIV